MHIPVTQEEWAILHPAEQEQVTALCNAVTAFENTAPGASTGYDAADQAVVDFTVFISSAAESERPDPVGRALYRVRATAASAMAVRLGTATDA